MLTIPTSFAMLEDAGLGCLVLCPCCFYNQNFRRSTDPRRFSRLRGFHFNLDHISFVSIFACQLSFCLLCKYPPYEHRSLWFMLLEDNWWWSVAWVRRVRLANHSDGSGQPHVFMYTQKSQIQRGMNTRPLKQSNQLRE